MPESKRCFTQCRILGGLAQQLRPQQPTRHQSSPCSCHVSKDSGQRLGATSNACCHYFSLNKVFSLGNSLLTETDELLSSSLPLEASANRSFKRRISSALRTLRASCSMRSNKVNNPLGRVLMQSLFPTIYHSPCSCDMRDQWGRIINPGRLAIILSWSLDGKHDTGAKGGMKNLYKWTTQIWKTQVAKDICEISYSRPLHCICRLVSHTYSTDAQPDMVVARLLTKVSLRLWSSSHHRCTAVSCNVGSPQWLYN